jgi:predicted glycogen debranching enzyme
MITFTKDTLHNFDAATSREWLETNGIGGFACSTVIGLNTRRYHALLTAAMHPPAGRVVLLSKLDETAVIDGQRYDLSSNQYSGAVHPQGYANIEEFRLDPYPIFAFVVAGVRIEKLLFMVHGQNTTVVQYRVRGLGTHSVQLELRPLVAFRDYHALTHENRALDQTVRLHHEKLASVRPYSDHPTLYLAHDANKVVSQGYWYKNFEYALERERGLDFVEDLFNPLTLSFDFGARQTVTLIASTEMPDVASAGMLRQQEVDRRARIVSNEASGDDLVRTLTAAADHYIVGRGDQKTVIAGYPWFTDWGRDTMIALPGLTLVTGRDEIARSILCEFAKHVDRGMLPNRFPDAGETPEYNTIDATFWYFEAVRSFLQRTADYSFVSAHLYSVLGEIIQWHIRGTRYGIKMDADALIASTDPNVQLTWMDAKIGDWVVTPRNGKPVEIQALWYNALRTMADIARQIGIPVDAQQYSLLADVAQLSFNQLFWNEEAACLYDVVLDDQKDGSIRPNQILAVSLTHSMLSKERARAVVNAVEKDLFTPYGLRSLSPSDSRYRGHYQGNPVARDGSYHQGTVWAWLLGPFFDAYFKVNGNGKKVQDQVRTWLQAFSSHLTEAGVGHVSEIFDGDPPHHPRGCFAQAWSVAEILRAIVENDEARNIPRVYGNSTCDGHETQLPAWANTESQSG